MESGLKINDCVSISKRSSRHNTDRRPLQGLVAFLGAVSFAEGDDWVGVRLIGDSVGHGKNDGSVDEVRYFDQCPPNGGIFIRRGSFAIRCLGNDDGKTRRLFSSRPSSPSKINAKLQSLRKNYYSRMTGFGSLKDDRLVIKSLTSRNEELEEKVKTLESKLFEIGSGSQKDDRLVITNLKSLNKELDKNVKALESKLLELELKFQGMSINIPAPPAPMLALDSSMNDGGNSISKMRTSIADTLPTLSSNDHGEDDCLIGTEIWSYGE